MTTNEVLIKQNFITKVLLKNGDEALSKDLKIKVMAMRIEYAKVRKAFDEDMQAFAKEITTDRLTELQQVPEDSRTDEQKEELKTLIDKANEGYLAYMQTRGQEEVTVTHSSLTEDEYNEIIVVNADNDVTINNQEVNAADFLEILYSLFVEDNE